MLKTNEFLLASLLTSYPDGNFTEYVSHLLQEMDLALPGNLRAELSMIVKDRTRLDDLRSEYIDLFDRGSASSSLYETEFGRDRALVKGSELADLAGFYKAFGFGMNEEAKEMLDHVSVELEFYTLLLMKQNVLIEAGDQEGIEIVLDARKKFLRDHLGRFIGALAERPAVQSSAVYSLVTSFCSELVRKECLSLDVSVTPVNWFATEVEKEEMNCCNLAGAKHPSP